MDRVAIIGGKLQGTEAVYLARKAGFKSLLIDKNEYAPASGFCDEFAVFDVLKKEDELIELLKTADFILPALENSDVHNALLEIAAEHKLKIAFDPYAYAISSSKLLSDRLIHTNAVPAPRYFPDCKSPYIIKPSGESGSVGVRRAETKTEVEAFLKSVNNPADWVVQEYLSGRSYSIEVIGVPGDYRTYAVTEIHMDDVYDCCMVTSPCPVTNRQIADFQEIAVKLASLVELHGIMDVEVIDDEGTFKVLEIDARIPSQTPMVVYHTTGMNLLSELGDIAVHGRFGPRNEHAERYSSIEHYLIDARGVHSHGEHIMGEARPLVLRESIFGADEVLSDYREGMGSWRGTFINSADTLEELEAKRTAMKRELLGSIAVLNAKAS